MNHLQIYYFSGTGNARKVAGWLNEEATQSGIDSKIINISQNRLAYNITSDTMIGFVSPTHGFNFPPLVLHFIFHFPSTGNHQPVFLMNTRAGTKLGPLFFPGLSGIALWLSALILWLKGYRIVGLRSIDMPSNWISLHLGFGPKSSAAIHARCEKKTRSFAKDILSGKKVYRALFDVIQDTLISPIAVVYFMIGRFILSKTLVASRDCNNCGKCIKECPVKAIYEVAGRPYWSYRCESCMRCINNCPQRAIQAAHGTFAAILMLVNTLIIGTFYHYHPVKEWIILNGQTWWEKLIRFTLEGFIAFVFLAIGWRIVQHLKRIKWFDAIVLFTSLTRFKWWRRYRA